MKVFNPKHMACYNFQPLHHEGKGWGFLWIFSNNLACRGASMRTSRRNVDPTLDIDMTGTWWMDGSPAYFE